MIENVTVESMNEVMARFMGGSSIKEVNGKRYVYYPKSAARDVQVLKYHTSWDWLMPVWKKAAKTLFEIRGQLSEEEYLEAYKVSKAFIDACQKVEIDKAHEAIYNSVQFITWYNQKQSDDN